MAQSSGRMTTSNWPTSSGDGTWPAVTRQGSRKPGRPGKTGHEVSGPRRARGLLFGTSGDEDRAGGFDDAGPGPGSMSPRVERVPGRGRLLRRGWPGRRGRLNCARAFDVSEAGGHEAWSGVDRPGSATTGQRSRCLRRQDRAGGLRRFGFWAVGEGGESVDRSRSKGGVVFIVNWCVG